MRLPNSARGDVRRHIRSPSSPPLGNVIHNTRGGLLSWASVHGMKALSLRSKSLETPRVAGLVASIGLRAKLVQVGAHHRFDAGILSCALQEANCTNTNHD